MMTHSAAYRYPSTNNSFPIIPMIESRSSVKHMFKRHIRWLCEHKKFVRKWRRKFMAITCRMMAMEYRVIPVMASVSSAIIHTHRQYLWEYHKYECSTRSNLSSKCMLVFLYFNFVFTNRMIFPRFFMLQHFSKLFQDVINSFFKFLYNFQVSLQGVWMLYLSKI